MGMRMTRRILRVSQKSEAYLLVTSAFERFQGRPRPDISIGAHFKAALQEIPFDNLNTLIRGAFTRHFGCSSDSRAVQLAVTQLPEQRDRVCPQGNSLNYPRSRRSK